MSRRKMEEELTCPICMELFHHPRRLPCGHSYCHACIKAMLDSRTEESGLYHSYFRPLICPECRDEISVDFVQGIEGLPLDFKLSKLVELIQFMKTKDDTSSSSDEDEPSRSASAVIPVQQPIPCYRGDSVSLPTAQSNTTATAISSGDHSDRSRPTAQTCPRSLAPQLSPTTDSNDARELETAWSLPGATALVESEQLDTVFLDSRPTSQRTSNLASHHETITSAHAPDGVANDEGNVVDATVRFGSLLPSGQSISCPSNVTSLAETPIHFSLSSLPGNHVASPTDLNFLRQNEARPLNAVGPSLLHQQRLSVDSSGNTRACSLPTLEATTRGRNKGLHEDLRFQPASSSSLSTLPIRSGAATGAVDSRKGSGSVEQRGKAEVPGEENRHHKVCAVGEATSKASKPKSSLRWRNLFGSSSSSSSSWSGSDLDDSDLRDTGLAQKGKACGSNHVTPVLVSVGKGTTGSTGLAASDSASRVGPSTDASVAKKNKKWLMTRFLRSVVFSDSSSTYSEDSDNDNDKICSNRRKDSAKDCVKSNSRDQDRRSKHAQTSSSLPNISEALNDCTTSQNSVRASKTSDNIGGSIETHGVTNNQTQHPSKSVSGSSRPCAEVKHISSTPAAHAGLACAKRPSVSSQTEIKEVDTSLSVGCRHVDGTSKPEVYVDTSQRLVLKRPSVSSQTDPKELSSSREQDENVLAGIPETRKGPSYVSSGKGSVTRETKVEQLPNVTHSFNAQCDTEEFNNQDLVRLPLGEVSPRTIYDNVSPNQNKSQPFPFELQNLHEETNFEAFLNPGAIHSRYDNYNSGASGSQAGLTCLDVNTSGLHKIATLKESTSNQSAKLEIDSHQTGFPRQEVISQGQRHSLEANHNPTLYDNVGIEDVHLGLYSSPQGVVARRVPGAEIEDLKTGLEHYCHRSQQQQHRQELHPTVDMENIGSPSLVSSVDEPSLLTSTVAEQEMTKAAGELANLHLVEPAHCTESHPPNLTSHLECDSNGHEVSRYDNMNSSLNQGVIWRDAGNAGDQQKVMNVVEGGYASHSCGNQPALGASFSEYSDQAKEEECGALSFSPEDQVCKAVDASHRSVNISPHMKCSEGQSACVSSDPAQKTNLGAVVKCPKETNHLSNSIHSHVNRTETAQTENNNNDYKSADVGAQHHGAAHEDERNDDADGEDEDDEENAHSSSAMLKTKKKKPRSKFTKFLTSLLSLSSSSEDEDYGGEDAEDSATTSSKSSDW